MARTVVLLRGINVGGHNRIAMPALREALTAGGYGDVRTYVQSGNVVLEAEAGPAEVAQDCQRRIAERFGLDIAVLARTRDELAEVVRRDPLGDVALNPKRYQVSFLAAELPAPTAEALLQAAIEPERLVVLGREIYAWHPDGMGRSKLWARLAGRGLGVTATARNWTTVTTLLQMADA